MAKQQHVIYLSPAPLILDQIGDIEGLSGQALLQLTNAFPLILAEITVDETGHVQIGAIQYANRELYVKPETN